MDSVVKITMLGASRVGKTSLLATMYEHATQAMVGKRVEFKSAMSEISENALQSRVKELKDVAGEFESTADMGVTSTQFTLQTGRTFSFSLGETGKNPFLQLDFIDYPGREFSSDSDTIRELVRDCYVILIVIDSPALMAESGKWNERINMPRKITEIFREAYSNLKDPRLVLLVPLKCEKYVQDPRDTDKFLRTIKRAYRDLLEFLASENLRSRVAIAITPVQTLGTAKFTYIIEVNGQPKFFFQAGTYGQKYQPRDGEQPLRYVLQFMLKLQYDQASQSWGIFSILRNIFQLDENMRNAVQDFSSRLNYELNAKYFEIIQGHQWLGIRS